MKTPEPYWTRKGPPIPEAGDLPAGTCSGPDRWDSLSPGMRREIWRDAVHRQAIKRQLPNDTISRLKIATITGGLGSLDEYLAEFERKDAARPAIREDVDRLQRADSLHRQSEVQIAAREAV